MAFLSGVQRRAKTDRLDGRGLALFALSVPLREFPVKSAAVEKVSQLLSARKGLSESAARLSQQRAELPHAAAALEAAVSSLREQIAALDREITTAAGAGGQDAEPSGLAAARALLLSVPGVGPVTAAAVAARLCSRRFATPDAFVAFCGLDVTVRDSGKSRGRRALTRQGDALTRQGDAEMRQGDAEMRQGDAEMRRLLYLCAQSGLRAKDSPFRAQYDRERAKGLPTTAALCAVARKLAKLCWSLHKHQAPTRRRSTPQGSTDRPVTDRPVLDNNHRISLASEKRG
jgi:transposase